MPQMQVLPFCLLLACSPIHAFLGRLMELTASTASSFMGNDVSESPSGSQGPAANDPALSKAIGYRPVTSVDYASDTLELYLQNNVIGYDDKLAARQYTRRNKGREPPADFWRSIPVSVECKPNESHGVLSSGYITCSVTLSEPERPVLSASFASYYLISPDPITGVYPEKKIAKFNAYVEELQTAAKQLAQLEELKPLIALFGSTSMGRRRFSPFHPSHAAFDLPVWMPHSPTEFAEEVEVICKLVLLTPARGGCDMTLFAANHPHLMYRLLYDPQNALPAGVPTMVDPPTSLIFAEHVKQHAIDTHAFLTELLRTDKSERVWTIKSRESSLQNRAMQAPLAQNVMALLRSVGNDDGSVTAIDCTRTLAYRTGSLLAPPTTSCFELDLFRRVLVGRVPGLWLIVRGQNTYEAYFSNLVNMPYKMQTNDEFTKWRPEGGSSLSWSKYHIHNGTKGLFIIILWDDDMEKYAQWYEQFDISQMTKIQTTCPVQIPNGGRVAVQPVASINTGNSPSGSSWAKVGSGSGRSSNPRPEATPLSASNQIDRVPSIPPSPDTSQITPKIYPELSPQQDVVKRYYEQGSRPKRKVNPISKILPDPEHTLPSLEASIELNASQDAIPRTPAPKPINKSDGTVKKRRAALAIRDDYRPPEAQQVAVQPQSSSPGWELLDTGEM